MEKIFINKNGKTSLHTLNTNYESENTTMKLSQARLNYLSGKKLVFNNVNGIIYCGDCMFINPFVESIEGSLIVETTANNMFSGASPYMYTNDGLTALGYAGGSIPRLKSVNLDCTATGCNYMFSNNEKLETANLTLPNCFNTAFLFQYCKSLKNVNLFAPLSTNAQACFRGCESLESVDISNMTNVQNFKDIFTDCVNLKSVVLPPIKYMSNLQNMFYDCRSLESVEFSFASENASGVTASVANMFTGCRSLHTITGDWGKLNSSGELSTILAECTALATFNASLERLTIGDYFFYNCQSLVNFSGSLAALTSGVCMFLRCKLNLQSVTNIITSMTTENNSATGTLTLGIDKTIKNEVKTYLENKGCAFTSETFDTDKSSTTTFVNAAGNTWNLEIYWN